MKNHKPPCFSRKNNEELDSLAVQGRCNTLVKEQKCAINTKEGVLGCHPACNPRPEGRKMLAIPGAAPTAALAEPQGLLTRVLLFTVDTAVRSNR